MENSALRSDYNKREIQQLTSIVVRLGFVQFFVFVVVRLFAFCFCCVCFYIKDTHISLSLKRTICKYITNLSHGHVVSLLMHFIVFMPLFQQEQYKKLLPQALRTKPRAVTFYDFPHISFFPLI